MRKLSILPLLCAVSATSQIKIHNSANVSLHDIKLAVKEIVINRGGTLNNSCLSVGDLTAVFIDGDDTSTLYYERLHSSLYLDKVKVTSMPCKESATISVVRIYNSIGQFLQESLESEIDYTALPKHQMLLFVNSNGTNKKIILE